ncbi:MAG: PKD domain-containing protein [Chitinophagaceae bacterium]
MPLKTKSLREIVMLLCFTFFSFYSFSQTSSFTVNDSAQCITGNSYIFSNTSTGSGNTYLWSFGDGTTSTSTNPSKVYTTAGIYSVELKVTNSGIDYYSSKTIAVDPMPVASFYSIASTQSGGSYTFISTSTITSGTMSYSWNFGDGTSSTQINPTKNYLATGTYAVTLTVTSNGGCVSTSTQNVNVTLAGLLAAFDISSLSSQCLSGNSFTFTNQSSTGGGITYSWNFGAGATPATFTGSNPPSVTYSSGGAKTVTLTVNSTSPVATAVSTQTVNVYANPTASFTHSNVANVFTFTSTSVNTSNVSWLSNGNNIGSGNTINYTYNTPGVYTIKLAAQNGNCYDTATQTITAPVAPPPTAAPVASFNVVSSSSQCISGNSFTFNNTSSGVGNTYQWSFPSATPSSSNSLNPGTVVFNASGVHVVTLTVTNAGGTSAANQAVTVSAKPTASFSYSNNGADYTFFNGSYISAGTISSYEWAVDGTNFSSIQNPPLQTLTAGTRVVRLIVVSDAGCRDTISQTINVTVVAPPAGAPVASFSFASGNTQCLSGNSFTFTNSSTGTGNTYAWTFAGGTPATSTSANPGTVTFATAGSHLVTLVATNVNGTSTSTQYAVIANPVASFNTYTNTSAGDSYTFISTSTVPSGTMTYSWNFGDGSPASSLVNPTHTYSTPGTYTVTLTVTGSNGCPATTTTGSVTYCPKAVAAFNVSSSTSQCLTGNSFTFNNTSSNTAGTPASGMSYLWKFGDGSTSTLQNPPAKSYAAWGDYDVQLFATVTSGGCTHTDSVKIFKAVSAEPMPVASYNLYLDTYLQATALYSDTVKRCFRPGMDFAYHSSSTVARGQMAIRKWSFETAAIRFREGDSVHYHNPRVIFDTAGTYHVKHTITTDKGCKDSVIRVVRLSDPRAVFTADTIVVPDAYAAPQVVLTNNSYDYGGWIMGYNWNFGGPGAAPTSSTAQNPGNVTYTCGGTKTLTLTITSDAGCTNTTTRNVVIKIKPRAGFTIGTPNYTPQVWSRPTIAMTNTTNSVDACASYAYAWTFTNATPATSSAANPSIVFNASGTQTVGLLVTNTNGGKTDYIENTVLVAIRPRANFTTSVAAATPNGTRLVTLNNTSSSLDANPSATLALHTYSVNWGDGSPVQTGTGTPTLTHTYAAGGVYSVSLDMTNPVSGLSHNRTANVTVYIQPQASFTTSAATYSPDAFAQPSYDFNASASTVSNDASGSLSYSWNFGAGASPATSTSVSPTGVVYASSGTKTVTLTVTNTNGNLTNVSTQNVVVAIKPKAAFTSALDYNGDVYSNPNVNFTNTSTINDGSASLSYSWNFGAGASPATSTSATPPSVTYSSGGSKTITLTVTNTFTGGTTTDTYTDNVNVVITPKARISVQNTVVAVPAPFGIGGAANYQSYVVSAISNPVVAQQSSVASGSIVSSLIEIDYTHIPSTTTTTNWVSQVGSPYTDVNFSIEDAIKADYSFTIRLYVTNDLGVTDVTSITIANGVQTGGHTYRLAGNAPAGPIRTPQVTVPPITRNTRGTGIVAASPVVNNLKGFVVYPNPTKNNVMVTFETAASTKSVSIQLVDLSGKVVRVQKEQNNASSKIQSTINVSNLPSGTYNVLLIDEKGNKLGTSKFVKAN